MLKFPKPGKKKKKQRPVDAAHILYIASLPCCCCGIRNETVIAHHLLRGVPRGMGRKADDKHTIPLCHNHHDALHRSGDEVGFLMKFGINDAVALSLSY